MKRQNTARSKQPKKKARTQAQTTQAIVKKELRRHTDWKYTDYVLNGQQIYNSGFIVSVLTNLTRGDNGYQNFQGNIIKPQAITMKYYAHTTEIFNTLRVMLIQWFDSGVPALSGILQTTTSGIGVISPTLVTNKQYIKVLYDKTHMLAPTAGGDTTVIGAGTIEPVTVYIPGKRLKDVRFNSTSNVVQDGDLILLAVSDDALISTVQLHADVRVTFADQ